MSGSLISLAFALSFYLVVDGFPTPTTNVDWLLMAVWLAVFGLASLRTARPKSPSQVAFFSGVILALATLLVGPFVRLHTPITPDSWIRESLYGASWSLLAFARLASAFRARGPGNVRVVLWLSAAAVLVVASAWWQRCFWPVGAPSATQALGIGVSRWLHTAVAFALAASALTTSRGDRKLSARTREHNFETWFAAVLLLTAWLRPGNALFDTNERVALMCALLLLALGEARVLGIERADELSLRALSAIIVAFLVYAASALPGTASIPSFDGRMRWVGAVSIACALSLVVYQWLSIAWSRQQAALQNAITVVDHDLLAATDIRGFASSLLCPLANAVNGEAILIWRAPAIDGIRIQRILSFTASRLGDCRRTELSVEHAALSMFDLTQRARTGSRATSLAMLLPLATRRPELRAGLAAAQAHNWQTWMELCSEDGSSEALVLLAHGEQPNRNANTVRQRLVSLLRGSTLAWTPLPPGGLRDLNALAHRAERALAIHARTERALLREHHALTHATTPNLVAARTVNSRRMDIANGSETPATSVMVSKAMRAATVRRRELAVQSVAVFVHGSDDERVMEWVVRLHAESEQRSGALVVFDLLHLAPEDFDLADAVGQAGAGTLVLRSPSVLSAELQESLGNAIATGKLRRLAPPLQPTALECRVILVSQFSPEECNLRPRLSRRVAYLKLPTLAERQEDVESIVLLLTTRYGRSLGRETHWTANDLSEIAERSGSVADLERNVLQKLRRGS